MGLIPGSGRSPGGGHGNPLQYSCLDNAMDRGAWWAIDHGVIKSWTWLKSYCSRGVSCSHTRLLKTCLVVFSPDQKMGSFRLIPAAFPWDPKALDPVLIQFSCSVWGSGSFRGLGVQTAIGAPCSSPWFWCHQCNLWDAGDSTLNPSLPIPHHWATPRAAGLDVIFANRNALVG